MKDFFYNIGPIFFLMLLVLAVLIIAFNVFPKL